MNHAKRDILYFMKIFFPEYLVDCKFHGAQIKCLMHKCCNICCQEKMIAKHFSSGKFFMYNGDKND